jgi:hypothetical protein
MIKSVTYTLLMGSTYGADPCRRLCEFDGPSICTEGSLTEPGTGRCRKYIYRGDPKNLDYCYQSNSVRGYCPVYGFQVRPEDVDRLIAHKQSMIERPRAESLSMIQWTSEGDALAGAEESYSATREKVWRFWDQLQMDLNERDLFPVVPESLKQLATEIEKIRGWRPTWVQLKGPALLDFARKYERFEKVFRAGFVGALMVANEVADLNQVEEFATGSGIREFCSTYSTQIGKIISTNMEESNVNGNFPTITPAWEIVNSFLRNMDKLCPELVNTSELRVLVLVHKHANISLQRFPHRPFIKVRRQNIFEDSVHALTHYAGEVLSLGVDSVIFEGEQAYTNDQGSVKEWFTLFMRELMDWHLFETTQRGIGNAYLSDCSGMPLNIYEAIGKFLALAVIHRRPLGILLPQWFFARILGRQVLLADIESEEGQLFGILNGIMTAANDEDLAAMVIDINGEEVQPTLSNRENVIERRLEALIPSTVEQGFETLRQGFQSVIPLLGDLTLEDLQTILVGSRNIDIEDLISNISLLQGRYRISRQILEERIPHLEWLDGLLRSLSIDDLRKFLFFATGSPFVPAQGFSALRPGVTVEFHEDIAAGISAHKSLNLIRIPQFSTETEFRDKLIAAIIS